MIGPALAWSPPESSGLWTQLLCCILQPPPPEWSIILNAFVFLLEKMLFKKIFPPVNGAHVTRTKTTLVFRDSKTKKHNFQFIFLYFVPICSLGHDWRNSFITMCHRKINTQVNWVCEGCVSSPEGLQLLGKWRFPPHCFDWLGGKTMQQLQLWPHAVDATHHSVSINHTKAAGNCNQIHLHLFKLS